MQSMPAFSFSQEKHRIFVYIPFFLLSGQCIYIVVLRAFLGETNKTKAELYHHIFQFHSIFKVGKEKIHYYSYRICFQPFSRTPLMNRLRVKVKKFAAISCEYNQNDFNIS